MAYTPKSSNPGTFDVYKTGSKSSGDKTYIRACSVQYAYSSSYLDEGSIANPFNQLRGAPTRNSGKTNDTYSYVFLKGFVICDNNANLLQRKCTISSVPIGGHDGYSQSGPHNCTMNVTLNGNILVPKNATIPIADRIVYQSNEFEYYTVYLSNFECDLLKQVRFDLASRCYYLGSSSSTPPSDFSGEHGSSVSRYDDVTVTVLAMRLVKCVNTNTNTVTDYTITDAIIKINDDVITLSENTKLRDEHFINSITGWGGSSDGIYLGHLNFYYDDSGTTELYEVTDALDNNPYDSEFIGISKLNTMLMMDSGGQSTASPCYPDAVTITDNLEVLQSSTIGTTLIPASMQQHLTVFTDNGDFEYATAPEGFDPAQDWEDFASNYDIKFEYFYNGKKITNYTYALYKQHGVNGLERLAFVKDANAKDLEDLTQDQIEKMEDLEIPYASMTSTGLFITPMEYYDGKQNGKVEGSKLLLENVTQDVSEDIPVYFWVETLKNWCTYEYEKLTEWNGFARLKVWNGKNGWYYLDEILQQQRANQLTAVQMNKCRDEYLAGIDTAKNLRLLTNYRNIIIANSALYRFPYEKLRTTVLQRVYTPTITPNWIVEDDTFFLVRFISKAVDFLGDWAMMIVDWSPIGLIYNSFTDGVGSAFGAGWNRWTSALGDIFDGFAALVSPVINWLFDDDSESMNTAERRLRKIDTRSIVVNQAEYLFLPYDTGYTSNDMTTFQTIRFRNEWRTDGIVSRHGLKAGHNIGNPMGSPMVVRSSTGELTLAISMTYQGPWEQFYGDDDYEKHVGISQNDVDMTNKMLVKMFGDGTDKTADDYLNIRGGLLEILVANGTSTSLKTVMANDAIEQTNAIDSASGTITLNANRSKTSSDVESATINTLKKW